MLRTKLVFISDLRTKLLQIWAFNSFLISVMGTFLSVGSLATKIVNV